MRTDWRRLAVFLALAIGDEGVARAQNAIDQFQPLVEISARRLLVAKQVALAKWDSGTAVEDPAREAKVIMDAVKDGGARRLDLTSVSNFFKAQIEANKIVQYSLLGDWYRDDRAPIHAPINLVTTVRPELDRIQNALVAELANTEAIRSSANCRVDVAKAVAKYLSSHRDAVGPLQAIALDRALAATCTTGP